LKFVLLREAHLVQSELFSFSTAAYLLGLLSSSALLLIGSLRVFYMIAEKSDDVAFQKQRAFSIFAMAALVCNLLFAVLWQGSDVERFAPSMPFVLLFFFQQTGKMWLLTRLFVVLFMLSNVLVVPLGKYSSDTGDNRWLLRGLAARLQKNDLVILSGQRLGAKVWAPLVYFKGLDVFHVLYEAQQQGAEEVLRALEAKIDTQSRRGFRTFFPLALLDPDRAATTLLQSQREYSNIPFGDIAHALDTLQRSCVPPECVTEQFEVAGIMFVQIERQSLDPSGDEVLP
jgi:hypothetical protein